MLSLIRKQIISNFFVIKEGALCFDIPLFFDKKDILGYFDESKNIRETERDKDKLRIEKTNLKKKLVKNFSKNRAFADAKINLSIKNCNGNYDGRFLCKCFSFATKFHDDEKQGKELVSISLGSAILSSPLLSGNVEIQISLHLTRENNSIYAHLLLNMQIENKSADELIAIKHAFYKNKSTIKPYGEAQYPEQNLSEWANSFIQEIYNTFEEEAPKETPNICAYSLLEITESFPILKITNEDNNQLLYGLITSDEGWRHFPSKEASIRMQNNWSSREYFRAYFLGSNGLILNYRNSKRAKCCKEIQNKAFNKYITNTDDNKYKGYVDSKPCFPGVDSLVIFNYQQYIIKRETLKTKLKLFSTPHKRIRDIKERIGSLNTELIDIRSVIDSVAFNLEEMDSLRKVLYNSFDISSDINSMRNIYDLKTGELKFNYDARINKNINILTVFAVVLAFLQFTISISKFVLVQNFFITVLNFFITSVTFIQKLSIL